MNYAIIVAPICNTFAQANIKNPRKGGAKKPAKSESGEVNSKRK